MTITWRRGGSTAKEWRDGGDLFPWRTLGNKVLFRIHLAAAGGGTTEVEILIHEDDFPTMSKLMYPAQESENERLLAENKRLLAENKRLLAISDQALKTAETLRAENEKLNTRILNESVRPDRVVEYRDRLLKAMEEVPLHAAAVKGEEWYCPQPEPDVSLYVDCFRA